MSTKRFAIKARASLSSPRDTEENKYTRIIFFTKIQFLVPIPKSYLLSAAASMAAFSIRTLIHTLYYPAAII